MNTDTKELIEQNRSLRDQLMEDPASMDRILTEAQEGLAKFIEEEFPS